MNMAVFKGTPLDFGRSLLPMFPTSVSDSSFRRKTTPRSSSPCPKESHYQCPEGSLVDPQKGPRCHGSGLSGWPWQLSGPRNMPIPVLRCCKAADPIIRPVPTVVLFWGTYRNLEYPHQRGWFIGWFIIRLVTLGADVPLLTRAIPARSTYRHLNYVVHVNVDELPSPFSNSYGHPNYPNSSPSLRNLPFNSAQLLPGTKVLMCTTEPLHCLKSSTVLLSSAVSSLRSSSARTSPRCGASSMALTPATVPKAAPRWRTRIPKLRPRGRQTRRPSGQAK